MRRAASAIPEGAQTGVMTPSETSRLSPSFAAPTYVPARAAPRRATRTCRDEIARTRVGVLVEVRHGLERVGPDAPIAPDRAARSRSGFGRRLARLGDAPCGRDDRLPPPEEDLPRDSLDDPGRRDRRERAENADELRSDEHGDQDGERRELHRPPVDDGLEDMVLELLVDDEEDDEDQPPDPTELEEADRRDDDRGERRAGQRHEIEHGHDDGERDRV